MGAAMVVELPPCPSPITRHTSPVTHHPSPVTHYPSPPQVLVQPWAEQLHASHRSNRQALSGITPLRI